MQVDLDIAGWIDGILSDGVLQVMTFLSIAIGIGLIFWGVTNFKQSEGKVWNVIAVLVGVVMIVRNLFNLFWG